MDDRNAFIFYFTLYISINLVSAAVWNDTEDISISVKGLYPTYVNSEIYSSQNIITGFSTVNINISDVPSNVSFLILQTHSYKYNLTLSYTRNLDIRYFINGTNLGLTLEKDPPEAIYLMNLQPEDVNFYLSIHAYYKKAPLPGGCNMEFNIEDAPYMRVWSNRNIIYADVAQARNTLDSDCDIHSLMVDHVFYQMYFSEWVYSEQEYFESIKKMITVEKIITHGTKVPVNSFYSKLKRSFSLYMGMPTLYAVIADNGQCQSAYVPTHHTTCTSCRLSGSDKFYMAMMFIFGFIMTFGNVFVRAFNQIVFVCLAVFLTMVLFFNVCDSYECGFYYGGLLWLVVLASLALSLPILANLGLSFLTFSVTLLIYDGSYNNTAFICYFFIIIVLVTIGMTILGGFGLNISMAIVGSFCLIILFDFVIGSYLRYIIMDSLRRLIVDDFNYAFINLPFQWRDAIVSLMWIFFAICGFLISFCFGSSQLPNSSFTSSSCCSSWNCPLIASSIYLDRDRNYENSERERLWPTITSMFSSSIMNDIERPRDYGTWREDR